MKEVLSLDRIKALKAIKMGEKPLYRVNEVVEFIPEGASLVQAPQKRKKHGYG